MTTIPLIIMILLVPFVVWDKIIDANYEWWRVWIGDKPRKVGDPPDAE